MLWFYISNMHHEGFRKDFVSAIASFSVHLCFSTQRTCLTVLTILSECINLSHTFLAKLSWLNVNLFKERKVFFFFNFT